MPSTSVRSVMATAALLTPTLAALSLFSVTRYSGMPCVRLELDVHQSLDGLERDDEVVGNIVQCGQIGAAHPHCDMARFI